MKLTKPIRVNGKVLPIGCDLALEEGIDMSLVPLEATDYQLHSELNQQIWNYETLKPEIRDRLLVIANDFFAGAELGIEIKDVIFTGSLANYNYHDRSDIDLHVLVDFNESKDAEMAKKYANSYRWQWNQKNDITIHGYEVEAYIQDVNEPHTASGIYSIQNNCWIVKPQHKTINVDSIAVTSKSNAFKSYIDDLENQAKKITKNNFAELQEMVDNVHYKVFRLRKDAFAEGEDEFSTGNLTFKELRNSGYIERLLSLNQDIYNKLKSI